MDLLTFRLEFKEFDARKDPEIQAALDKAALDLDAEQLGNSYEAAHGYLTAHRLALSPPGIGARLVPATGDTTYWKHFRQICINRVTGIAL